MFCITLNFLILLFMNPKVCLISLILSFIAFYVLSYILSVILQL